MLSRGAAGAGPQQRLWGFRPFQPWTVVVDSSCHKGCWIENKEPRKRPLFESILTREFHSDSDQKSCSYRGISIRCTNIINTTKSNGRTHNQQLVSSAYLSSTTGFNGGSKTQASATLVHDGGENMKSSFSSSQTSSLTSPSSASSVSSPPAVMVTFQNGTESLFHAVWLWSNDSNIIHASSGQRTRSPSSFFHQGWMMEDVRVVRMNDKSPVVGKLNCKDQEENGRQFIPPAPNCLLPYGSVYQTDKNGDTDKEKKTSQSTGKVIEPDCLVLEVTWIRGNQLENGNDATSSDDHDDDTKSSKVKSISYYDIDWLWRCRYDKKAVEERDRATVVDKTTTLTSLLSTSTFSPPIVEIEFDSIVNSEQARFEALRAIFEQGAMIIQGAPSFEEKDDTEPTVGTVGRLFSGGSLSHGHLYDDIFYVKSVEGANNIAYTSHPLTPHQDLAYYQSPPGLQLLHCVVNHGVVGGESTLIDAVAAATEFQHLAPDLFEVLTTCPATFLKQRHNADMIYRCPHITVDNGGSVVGIRWSPPFEGPVCFDSDKMEDYFVAMSAFELMIDNHASLRNGGLPLAPTLVKALREYANEYTWERQLRPGEILVFNNQRMLHGRRGFNVVPEDSTATRVKDIHGMSQPQRGRILIGCYTNMEETVSQYRLLRRLHLKSSKDIVYMRNVGNCSSGIS